MRKKQHPEEHEIWAAALGKHPVYIKAVLRGKQRCSFLLALRLEKVSRGKIKAVDLRPDIAKYL